MDALQKIRWNSLLGWTRPPPLRMTVASLATALTVLLLLVACSQPGEKVELLVTVGSELEDCAGPASMKCLLVNGELFYDTIEGFDHEEGFYYRLKIEREDAFPGEEPPQDSSRYRYRLIEEISKTISPR